MDSAFADDQDTFWHSSAHLLCQAVMRLYPHTKYTIGPTIDEGFYYDFLPERPFEPEDLEKIEAEMQKIVDENLTVEHHVWTSAHAIDFFTRIGQPFKVELIQDLKTDKVSVYRQGEFTDLCMGPHLRNTGRVRYFKLLTTAGCYWRASEKRERLQRVYGISYADRKMLKAFLQRREEAAKRDHRKLGTELELFGAEEVAGGGMIFFHPKGSAMRMALEDFIRRAHRRHGYEYIYSPHILKADLWKISGHYEHYRENMYFTKIDDQEYGIKPMNCPGHILVYRSRLRSYRELPVRFFELGTVYRYERSGVLHGLLRVRGFTQDDAHIFCTEEQLTGEIEGVLAFVEWFLGLFGFEYTVGIGTRPEKYIGEERLWEKATSALKEAAGLRNIRFEIHEGDGAFYGPKIDIALKDALGRSWQGPTIQVDFALPERFQIEYVDETGARRRPVMIHRAICGSLERFIGCLTEHYSGDFPLWLAPIQTRVLPVADSCRAYAHDLRAALRRRDVRADVDEREETLGKRVRAAELEKIRLMAVIGEREVENRTVTLRRRGSHEQQSLPFDEFVDRVARETLPPEDKEDFSVQENIVNPGQ